MEDNDMQIDNMNLNQMIKFCDNMEIATEGKIDNKTTLKKQLLRSMGHLAKFKYKTKDCTGHWIDSIIGSYLEMRNNSDSFISKYNNDDFLDDAYSRGIRIHACDTETGYSIDDFPKKRPDDWDIYNLTDPEFIRNELMTYVEQCDDINIHRKDDIINYFDEHLEKRIGRK